MKSTTRWLKRAAVVMSTLLAVTSTYAAETRPAAGGASTDSKAAVTAELEKPVVRGAIVFKNYCVLCHGYRGDGPIEVEFELGLIGPSRQARKHLHGCGLGLQLEE